jgi:MFS family permease
LDSFSALIRQQVFVRVWVARVFGTTANQMLLVALGWQMYELTGSAWDLGLVGLYQFVPALLFTLPAGHLADRVARARIVLACYLSQGLAALYLLLGSLALDAAAGHTVLPGLLPWVHGVSGGVLGGVLPPVSRTSLLAVSVVIGIVRAFQMPAQQAITPLLVPPMLFPRATAMSAAGIQAAVIGGPALGGLIFIAGASAVYATCAALFVVAWTLMALVTIVQPPPVQESATLRTVFAGFEFIWHRKLLLGALSLDLFAMLFGGATALLPMFAKDILQVGPQGLGLLRAAPAVGALAMSIWLARHPPRRRVGAQMLWGVVLYGAAMVVFGLSTSFWLSMLMLAASGVGDMVNIVVRQTLVQLETPDAMRGRVSAANSIFIGASNQLGEFESGVTAAWWGPVGSVVVGGLATIGIAAIWWKRFPELARRDRMQS